MKGLIAGGSGAASSDPKRVGEKGSYSEDTKRVRETESYSEETQRKMAAIEEVARLAMSGEKDYENHFEEEFPQQVQDALEAKKTTCLGCLGLLEGGEEEEAKGDSKKVRNALQLFFCL